MQVNEFMNQDDFENVVALALMKKITPMTAAKMQRDFETAVTLVLRHITPVTAGDIEHNTRLIAPAFEMDDTQVAYAIKNLETRFLPCTEKQ